MIARFEFEPRSLPIVILDAQQHLAVAIARRAPDMQGVDDVAEVQIAGRRRRKACQHVQIRIACLAVARPREGGAGHSIARIDRSADREPSSGTALAYKPSGP